MPLTISNVVTRCLIVMTLFYSCFQVKLDDNAALRFTEKQQERKNELAKAGIRYLFGDFNHSKYVNRTCGKCVMLVFDLNCDKWDDCPYESIENKENNVSWSVVSGNNNIDPRLWHLQTGTLTVADLPILLVELTGPGKIAKLQSDPISCTQSSTIVQFRYWLTESARIEVCLRTEAGIEICSVPYGQNSDQYPGPIHAKFNKSIPVLFSVVFYAFGPDPGFVALDDIVVKMTKCLNPWPCGFSTSSTTTTPLPTTSTPTTAAPKFTTPSTTPVATRISRRFTTYRLEYVP